MEQIQIEKRQAKEPSVVNPDQVAAAATEGAPWDLAAIKAGSKGAVVMKPTLGNPIIMPDAHVTGIRGHFPHGSRTLHE